MESQPLFIVGSPRSGTTFLVNVLNQHPSIHITNESRVFSLLNDMINNRSWRPGLLGSAYREKFVSYTKHNAGSWVEQFYRNELAVSEPIWGDKYPGYAAVWGGRTPGESLPTDADAGEHDGATPVSSLRLIRECLPSAKFIHIHRDPRLVANSLHQKGWVGSIDAGAEVWRQRVEEIDGFFREIARASRHIIAYASLLEDPEQVTDGIARFLGLADEARILEFLIQQRAHPTSFSGPVRDLAMPRRALPQDVGDRLLRLAGPCAEAFGYH